jgi:hypothetical protein
VFDRRSTGLNVVSGISETSQARGDGLGLLAYRLFRLVT